MRLVAAAFALLLTAQSALAGSAAEEAFAARDFEAAKAFWLVEAEDGSARAMLGLGLLADLGLGGPRDREAAYDWYLSAARRGLAEAQFNVAVFQDSGIGRPRNARSALIWYTRAALRGFARAKYNAGLMLAAGEGGPRDPELAAYWFRQAAPDLPAAQDRLGEIGEGDAARSDAPPKIVFDRSRKRRIELVWTSGSTGPGDTFLVELFEDPGTGDFARPVAQAVTRGSGIILKHAPTSKPMAWRVSRIEAGGERYVAGEWRSSDPDAVGPKGRITLLLPADNEAARLAAMVFADDLRAAGYWVRLVPATLPAAALRETLDARSGVVYGFAQDRPLAELIADYFPALSASDVVLKPGEDTLPGEIEVRLAASGS